MKHVIRALDIYTLNILLLFFSGLSDAKILIIGLTVTVASCISTYYNIRQAKKKWHEEQENKGKWFTEKMIYK